MKQIPQGEPRVPFYPYPSMPGDFYATRVIGKFRANAILRRDPTRTITLRRAYEAEMVRRFKIIRKLIIETVVKNDALYLKPEPPPGLRLQVQPVKKFVFRRDSVGKLQDFLAWLNTAIDEHVLAATEGGVVPLTPTPLTAVNWQGAYVTDAYNKGLAQANAHLSNLGILPTDQAVIGIGFNLPIDVEALNLLYTRQFELLKGITTAMSSDISRVLTQGFAEGIGPREIGKRITKSVDKIGIIRGRMIARTEVINVYNQAALNRYETFQIPQVTAMVEFSHSGDDRVCQRCLDLEGKKYTIPQARGVIPIHPNCRCTWLPVV
jgi:SPP1 gp7 family putative phage head morphogenesis protein